MSYINLHSYKIYVCLPIQHSGSSILQLIVYHYHSLELELHLIVGVDIHILLLYLNKMNIQAIFLDYSLCWKYPPPSHLNCDGSQSLGTLEKFILSYNPLFTNNLLNCSDVCLSILSLFFTLNCNCCCRVLLYPLVQSIIYCEEYTLLVSPILASSDSDTVISKKSYNVADTNIVPSWT